MNDSEYYDIEFTPAIGCYYLNNMFSQFDDVNIPFYKAFLIFPLFSNDDFLAYILQRTRTYDFYKIISDYTHEQKSNDFWLDYNIKYISSRIYCFESIYFGVMAGIFETSDSGIKINRILSKELPFISNQKNMAIKKIGELIKNIDYMDLFRILKVGEVHD